MQPAIALLEFSSVAAGIEAGDAMVKRAPLDAAYAGTIHPGKYVVVVGGDTASVDEAVQAGTAIAGQFLTDIVVLPDVHPDVVAALGGRRLPGAGEALGIIETTSVGAVVDAADAGRKGADVELAELRLGDDLGGRAYVLFYGAVANVEAAVEIGTARISASRVIAHRVISQLHPEMHDNLAADARFRGRAGTIGGGS